MEDTTFRASKRLQSATKLSNLVEGLLVIFVIKSMHVKLHWDSIRLKSIVNFYIFRVNGATRLKRLVEVYINIKGKLILTKNDKGTISNAKFAQKVLDHN